MSKKKLSLTEGNILIKLIRFAIPILLSSILQMLYSTADAIIVGRFVGAYALAAVGATGPVVSFIVEFFVSLSEGSGIVVSQLVGARDKENVKKAVHTSIALSLIGGAVLMIFGLLAVDKMISLMNTPKEVVSLSKTYLSIYFFGMIPSMFYNFFASILRASGDSKRPFKILSVSGIVNVGLNVVFVVVFKWGVIGVSVATVISQIVSASLMLRILLKSEDDIKLSFSQIRIYKGIMKRIVRIGIPLGVAGATSAFSNAVIRATVNSFGASATAGATASNHLETYVLFFISSMTIALATFIGQNYGAGNLERCKKGFRITFIAEIVMSVLAFFVFTPFAKFFVGFFADDVEIIENGCIMFRVFVSGLLIYAVLNTITRGLLGYGDSVYQMIINVFGVTGIRLIWIYFVLPYSRNLFMLYLSMPVSWLISLIFLIPRYIYITRKIYKEEGYKNEIKEENISSVLD